MSKGYRNVLFGLARGVILLALVTCVAGCDRTAAPENPLGPEPEEPAPAGFGTLEVTVTVAGTRPDADGYVLVVTSDSLDQLGLPMESEGGTIRFTNLQPGSHSVRLEGLAANCTASGKHPRPFTIESDRTSRVGFLVRCPGPGALLVRTVTQGILDPDGYAVAVEATSPLRERIGTNDSLLIRGDHLLLDEVVIVGLSELPQHCLVQTNVIPSQALVSSNPLSVRPPADATVRVTFTATCLSRASTIVYSDGDIHSLAADGGLESTNLTRHPAHDYGPSLSPDRSRIVFSSDRDDPNVMSELYSMNADGSGLVRLTHSPSYDWVGPQAWSPDGSRIVFTSARDNPNGEIYVMNADGGGVVRLTDSSDSGAGCPAWSPDGAWIAFCREGGIYRMPPSGGSEVLTVTTDGFDPAWSPDGSKIAFSRGYGWDYPLADLAVIAVDGTAFVQLHPAQDNNDLGYGPSWSPDGSWIAFTRTSRNSEVVIVPFLGDHFGEVVRLSAGYSPSWR